MSLEPSFLLDLLSQRTHQYRKIKGLLSDFDENIWIYNFITHKLVIDFNIKLEDGTFLTDAKNHLLLNTIKYWLCVQGHYEVTGGIKLILASIYNKTIKTLHLIDYFLINSRRFQLSLYGFELINENDLKALFADLVKSKYSSESIYRWSSKLSDFLRKHINLLNPEEFENIKIKYPEITKIDTDLCDRALTLTDEEIIKSRAYLISQNLYGYRTGKIFSLCPNTEKLASVIYNNTLLGKTFKPIPEELCFKPLDSYRREFESAPVRTELNERSSIKVFAQYKRSLQSLSMLAELDLPVPIRALSALPQEGFIQAMNLKPIGRFQTLPPNVVFSAFRNAVEFAFEYGEDLIESYLGILQEAKKNKMHCNAYSLKFDIKPLITPKIKSMGVRTWHLCVYMNLTERTHCNGKSCIRPSSEEFFKRLRANEGLFELLNVLFASVQIVIGTLMARRQKELLDLIAYKSLDKTKRFLIFKNGKSGFEDDRDTEARPIPILGVKLIELLERIQHKLIELEILQKPTNLFSRPDHKGNLSLPSSGNFNRSLDYFCDYFQTPLNAIGQRYYIRQHQLRRFFAMLFFWSKSYGYMDTLRWFLGHTDIEHLYHYITESTPGEVLKHIKIAYAAEQIKEGGDGIEYLENILKEHFGTAYYSIIDNDELEDYIEYLMDQGTLEIEPEFFDTPDGQSWKVLIKVRKN